MVSTTTVAQFGQTTGRFAGGTAAERLTGAHGRGGARLLSSFFSSSVSAAGNSAAVEVVPEVIAADVVFGVRQSLEAQGGLLEEIRYGPPRENIQFTRAPLPDCS